MGLKIYFLKAICKADYNRWEQNGVVLGSISKSSVGEMTAGREWQGGWPPSGGFPSGTWLSILKERWQVLHVGRRGLVTVRPCLCSLCPKWKGPHVIACGLEMEREVGLLIFLSPNTKKWNPYVPHCEGLVGARAVALRSCVCLDLQVCG